MVHLCSDFELKILPIGTVVITSVRSIITVTTKRDRQLDKSWSNSYMLPLCNQTASLLLLYTPRCVCVCVFDSGLIVCVWVCALHTHALAFSSELCSECICAYCSQTLVSNVCPCCSFARRHRRACACACAHVRAYAGVGHFFELWLCTAGGASVSCTDHEWVDCHISEPFVPLFMSSELRVITLSCLTEEEVWGELMLSLAQLQLCPSSFNYLWHPTPSRGISLLVSSSFSLVILFQPTFFTRFYCCAQPNSQAAVSKGLCKSNLCISI